MFDIRFTWFYHCLSLKVSSSQSPNAFVFRSQCLAPDHTRWFKKWLYNKWMSSQVPNEWKVIWMNLGLFSFGSMVHKVIKKNGLPSHSHSVKKTVSVWTLFIVFLIESVREVNVKNVLCTKRKGNSCIICLSIRCYNKAQPSPYDWDFVGVGIIKQFLTLLRKLLPAGNFPSSCDLLPLDDSRNRFNRASVCSLACTSTAWASSHGSGAHWMEEYFRVSVFFWCCYLHRAIV